MLVVIDPRRTETAEEAALHLPIRPGSDVALMNGLLQHCREAGVVDEDYLAAHVAVPTEFWDQLGEGSDLWSEIGRASCRERVWQHGSPPVGGGQLKKKTKTHQIRNTGRV